MRKLKSFLFLMFPLRGQWVCFRCTGLLRKFAFRKFTFPRGENRFLIAKFFGILRGDGGPSFFGCFPFPSMDGQVVGQFRYVEGFQFPSADVPFV